MPTSSSLLYKNALLVDAYLVDTYEREEDIESRSRQWGKNHTLDEPFLVLVRQVFQSPAHGFREKKGREDPSKHEECKYFEAGKSGFEKQSRKGKRHKMYMCPMNLFVPPMFLRRWNPTWAMTAPNLPLAAEMPCAVDR